MIINELDQKIMKLNVKHKEINFSKLAKEFGVDRHTVKRHYESSKLPTVRKPRKCFLNDIISDIADMFADGDNPSVKSIYMELLNLYKYSDIGSYSNFKQFVRRHKSEVRPTPMVQDLLIPNVHYRFETMPGRQLQFDWIENLTLRLSDGKEVTFNIWSATLGCSRQHVFLYTDTITEADFRRCLIETFVIIGGMTETVLTDNMSAIVSVRNGEKHIHPTVKQFMADIGVKLSLCKIRTPETKGKVEVSNKYQEWLRPYDGKFATKEDLIRGVEQILMQSNYQKNSSTGMAPAVLAEIEKRHLKPLPMTVLKAYHSARIVKKVSKSALMTHNNASYGVPSEYVNTDVLMEETDKEILIYSMKLEKIAHYPIYDHGIHYSSGLYSVSRMKGETEEQYKARVDDNLRMLAGLGGQSDAASSGNI